MSAIGGVIDFKDGAIDFSVLDSIRKVTCLRGKEKSSAYIDVGVGMFCNMDEFSQCEQPIIADRRGYKSIFLMDSPYLDGNAVFEKYRCMGVDFLGLIDAPFSLAVYDSERRLFLLARDREGKKPLYYFAKAGRVYFSSEAKGILETMDRAPRVDGEALALHIISPAGVFGAADIYKDVCEVRPGECILFNEVGMSRFFFRRNVSQKRIAARNLFKEKDGILEGYCGIEEDDVKNALSDSLIAFDLPQFHSEMPMICRLFSSVKEKNSSVFRYRDYSRRTTARYSNEVDDRLGNFYGVLPSGVLSRADSDKQEYIDEENKRIYEILQNLFYRNANAHSLDRFLGRGGRDYLLRFLEDKSVKKEDTEMRIRILGMLCQLSEWERLRVLDVRCERNVFESGWLN